MAVFGQGDTAPLAIYAAILDPQITEVILADPPESHADPHTPEFLGILRIGDLPQNLALVYPRPITFVGAVPAAYEWTRAGVQEAGRGRSHSGDRQRPAVAASVSAAGKKY